MEPELGIRTQQEVDEWMTRCPIKQLEQKLVRAGMSEAEMQEVRRKAAEEVAEATQFARESPLPDVSEADQYVFSS